MPRSSKEDAMRSSRAEWAKRVERWQEGDLTAREFAAETGINARTLTYWKWRLAKEAREGAAVTSKRRRRRPPKRAKAATPKPTFVEVSAPAPIGWQGAERIEVVVDQRLVVRVPETFEPRTLRLVVSALTGETA